MLVVDASVALAWCLGDEDAGRLDGVLRRLLGEGGLAPGQWALEVTNALRTAGRSRCSPMAIETSYFPASNPNDPASPQQPGSGCSTSTPIFFKRSISSWSPMTAF